MIMIAATVVICVVISHFVPPDTRCATMHARALTECRNTSAVLELHPYVAQCHLLDAYLACALASKPLPAEAILLGTDELQTQLKQLDATMMELRKEWAAGDVQTKQRRTSIDTLLTVILVVMLFTGVGVLLGITLMLAVKAAL